MKKKLAAKPPTRSHSFRLYISPCTSPEYVDVFIYKTHEELNRARKHREEHDQLIDAFFRPDNVTEIVDFRDENEFHRGNPHIGDIHFCEPQMHCGILVHELYHAVTFWAHKIGCCPGFEAPKATHALRYAKPDNEEVCATVIGDLMGQLAVAIGVLIDEKKLKVHNPLTLTRRI